MVRAHEVDEVSLSVGKTGRRGVHIKAFLSNTYVILSSFSKISLVKNVFLKESSSNYEYEYS